MSNYDQYPYRRSEHDDMNFLFSSNGPKGEIEMGVRFEPVLSKNIFNLAFGNQSNDGTLDDIISNNNGDRNKILKTVASIVFDFTESLPDCLVFFQGSTPGRTRLYRIAITMNLSFIAAFFSVWGVSLYGNIEPFRSDQNYVGFLIKRN